MTGLGIFGLAGSGGVVAVPFQDLSPREMTHGVVSEISSPIALGLEDAGEFDGVFEVLGEPIGFDAGVVFVEGESPLAGEIEHPRLGRRGLGVEDC